MDVYRTPNFTGLWSKARKFNLAVTRSLRTFQVLDGRPRETSFPFISGDTYRSLADVYFDLEYWKRYKRGLRTMPRLEQTCEAIVFVECILLRDKAVETEFVNWVESLGSGVRLKVIFANGDDPPSLQLRKLLVSCGHTVFGHNLKDGEDGVVPVPLGLQNLTHRKFGVLSDFLLHYDQVRNPPNFETARSTRVYGNFSVSSNEKERSPLKLQLEKSRFGFVRSPLSVREHRARMLDAQFVPSPPGIGPDCYRTWEALYLGAVPVIKSGTLAESISTDLPIWVVDDWDDLVGASDDDLDQKFLKLSSAPREKALFPYWQTRIYDA